MYFIMELLLYWCRKTTFFAKYFESHFYVSSSVAHSLHSLHSRDCPPAKKGTLKSRGKNHLHHRPKTSKYPMWKKQDSPPQDEKKGVYRYECPCSDKSVYIGQTARSCDLRWDEHGKAIQKENWSHSGISQHHQHCHEQFDKSNATVITTMQGKNKKSLAYNLKIREALEIRRHNSGPGKGLNEDMGAYVKTDMWDPVLHTMD